MWKPRLPTSCRAFARMLCLVALCASAALAAPQSSPIELETPFRSSSLSGIVLDTEGRGIGGVLIEECERGWKKCFKFARTDKNGRFVSAGRRTGEHFLRFSSEGFETLEIRVIVYVYTMRSLEVRLEVAT
jgi:hypothetical protein